MENDVEVKVTPRFIPERSEPGRLWFYAYDVVMTNRGTVPCQLKTRHWIITDGNGHVEEVRGEGVVGHKPELNPGESFRYSSACPLPTSSGAMRGSYQMVNAEGEAFDAPIQQFALVRMEELN